MSVELMAIFMVIVFVSAMAQGVSGFGFCIIFVSFWPLFMSNYSDVLALVSTLTLLMLVMMAYSLRKYIVWSWIPVPAGCYFLINAVAITVLDRLPNLPWGRYLGGALVLLGFYMFFLQNRLSITPSISNGALIGAVSGAMGGFFGVGGPLIVIYYLALAKSDKLRYQSTLQMFFLLTAVGDFGMRVIHGMINGDVLKYIMLGIICLGAGLYCGQKIFRRLSAENLRKVICITMMFSGILLMLR